MEIVRKFIISQQGKIINHTNPIIFSRFKNLVSHHPTWKKHDILCFKVTRGLNSAAILQVKPTWSSKFIVISWRKCAQHKDNFNEFPFVCVQLLQVFNCAHQSNLSLFKNKQNNTPTQLAQRLTGAMRYAIRRQIMQWKESNRIFQKCQQCLTLLHLHADHVIPFTIIQQNFLKLQTQPLPTKFRYNRKTCQPQLLDVSFARRWQFYHKKHAKLQWLCKTCNLSKGCKN